MNRYCFINGEIVSSAKARIDINDVGLLRGYGIFEVIRTYNSKPFLLKEHLDRFENSARELELKVPLSQGEISEKIEILIKKNGKEDIAIRIILTGGETNNGISFNINSPTFLIQTEDLETPTILDYQKGVKLITVEHQRIFPSIKTLNYIFPIKTKRKLRKENFFDLLYTSQGKILESTTSNFFIIKGNTLITAKNNVLMGTTRNFVIDIAQNDFTIEERDITKEEIASADETFLTATNKEIVPVVRIDDLVIGDGSVGKKTKLLMSLFEKRLYDKFPNR